MKIELKLVDSNEKTSNNDEALFDSVCSHLEAQNWSLEQLEQLKSHAPELISSNGNVLLEILGREKVGINKRETLGLHIDRKFHRSLLGQNDDSVGLKEIAEKLNNVKIGFSRELDSQNNNVFISGMLINLRCNFSLFFK